jgi:hypothetical protein
MRMIQQTEIDGEHITLQVEHAGFPWWLIVHRDKEIWSKIFDSQFEAEQAFERVAMGLAHDHLKRTIGDDARYARVLKLLGALEDDPFFRQAVRAKNDRLVESLLGGILEQSEEAEAMA